MELVISLAMVAIITGAVLQVARFSETHKSLTLGMDELRAVIRSAQSSSLSIPNPEARHVCGYGVYVSNVPDAATGLINSYELFYTYVETDVYRDDPNTCINVDDYRTYANTTTGTSRDTIQNFKLSENLEFTAHVGQSIFFIAPYGEVFGNDGSQLSGVDSFTIRNTSNGGTRSIGVNEFGKIE